MESNWRWNVHASGWQGSEIDLVARMVTPILFWDVAARTRPDPVSEILLGYRLAGGYVEAWSTVGLLPIPGVIWPMEVVPDHPAEDWD